MAKLPLKCLIFRAVAKVVEVVAFFHRVRDVLLFLIHGRAGVEHRPATPSATGLKIPLDFLGFGGPGDFRSSGWFVGLGKE